MYTNSLHFKDKPFYDNELGRWSPLVAKAQRQGIIEFFIAEGKEKREGDANSALEVLRGSASGEILEPLVVGLAMYVGEDVKVAAEIMEVGKDVVKRIEQRGKEMEA